MLKTKELHKYIISKIKSVYGEQEASSVAFILMEYFNISKLNYVLDDTVTYNNEEIENIIIKLNKSEPIQYVLEEAWFYDRRFKVDKNVLIPRPETEELCDLIISKFQKETSALNFLDIGTGSGCIPITLKLEMPNHAISALDISESAINIAQQNAEFLNVDIDFIKQDILNDDISLSEFDIVVSNPPYVLNSEKKLMKQNVLDNEPHLALFVDDENPLIFYKKITELCAKERVKHLYFEINELYGKEVVDLMVTNGYKNALIKKDLQGVDRIVFGSL